MGCSMEDVWNVLQDITLITIDAENVILLALNVQVKTITVQLVIKDIHF